MSTQGNDIWNCFNFVKLSFVNLPENCLDFYSNYAKLECSNCHKKEINGYVCLICGEKTCNLKTCLSMNKKGRKEFSLVGHSKKCCGGNTLYLSIKDSQIVYYLKRKFAFSDIFLYVNKYGDHIDENYLPSDFNLDEKMFDKVKINYLDLQYRQSLGNRVDINNNILLI